MSNTRASLDYNGAGLTHDGNGVPMRILVVEDDETVADALKGLTLRNSLFYLLVQCADRPYCLKWAMCRICAIAILYWAAKRC